MQKWRLLAWTQTPCLAAVAVATNLPLRLLEVAARRQCQRVHVAALPRLGSHLRHFPRHYLLRADRRHAEFQTSPVVGG